MRRVFHPLPRGGAHEERSEGAEVDLAELALVSLTTAWSFPEAITMFSLSHRDAEDVIAAMELLRRAVASLSEAPSPELLAEGLFSGLARGEVPDEFVEAHIMALTGWSWETLMETPADVIERLAIYLAVKQVRAVGGTLDFPEERHEQ